MNDYKKLKIKEWALEDRPREKLLNLGARFLSDAELIAILIGSGNLNETAVELSRRILSSVNNDLNVLSRKGTDYLKNFNGIGEAKAISIAAALELANRRKESEVYVNRKITCSKDAADVFMPILGDLYYEEFWILLLNRGNKIINYFRISQGGLTATITDIRIILKLALENRGVSIILCHNHPSGTMEASDADLNLTRKVKQSAELMDIQVIDHIIIGQNRYLSLADEGMLH